MAIDNAFTWNGFNFNSHTKDLTPDSPDAWWTELFTADGLWGFDFTSEGEKVPQDVGVRFFTEFKEGHTVTPNGVIVAKDLACLRTAEVAMMQACWPLTDDKLFFQMAGFDPMYVNARVGQSPGFTLDKSQQF